MQRNLANKTIILTGTSYTQSVAELITAHGGKILGYPLIETVERIEDGDAVRLTLLSSYSWLIFTSQNAVSSFLAKCARHSVDLTLLAIRIAAVGDKTAALLREHGLAVHFIPSIFSADVFVEEFSMEPGERALFLRGSIAKSTIRDGVGADEWTVYETAPSTRYIEAFEQSLHAEAEPIVIFASPSAVEVYAEHIAPSIDWQYVKFAAIGHVTAQALKKHGVTPIVQPRVYTMKAIIEQLLLEDSQR